MLYTSFIALLTATSVLGAATTPVDPNTVTGCLKTCTVSAAKAAGCINPLQTSCVCAPAGSGTVNSAFQNAAANCLIANCVSELSNAIALGTQLCTYGVNCQGPAFSLCGTGSTALCIEVATETCVSGVPTRRGLGTALCKPNERACKVGTISGLVEQNRVQNHKAKHASEMWNAFECIDIMNNLEACGGCPDEQGEDCSTIYGAAEVSCVHGRCVVNECEEGLDLIHGRCK